MRREERVTVQGPIKKQQPDGISHRGVEGTKEVSPKGFHHWGLTKGVSQWGLTKGVPKGSHQTGLTKGSSPRGLTKGGSPWGLTKEVSTKGSHRSQVSGLTKAPPLSPFQSGHNLELWELKNFLACLAPTCVYACCLSCGDDVECITDASA